ncbi:unnamed protein product [Orchesella dallaii]|uniref:Uncharacterized protein n=1 Tax=Orchesella dallaii TaxID=48710 RepID=A0ABP1SAH0_9HEXA
MLLSTQFFRIIAVVATLGRLTVGNAPKTTPTRVYSHYVTEKPYSDDIITNLNEHLEAFKDCFILLINYNGIDINPTQLVPVVLVRYDTFIEKTDGNKYLVRYELFEKVSIENVSEATPYETDTTDFIDRQTTIPIQLRSLLDAGANYVHLEKPTILNWKTWVCERYLYLFPPVPNFHSNFELKSLYRSKGKKLNGRNLFYEEKYLSPADTWRICRQYYTSIQLRLIPRPVIQHKPLITRSIFHILLTNETQNYLYIASWFAAVTEHSLTPGQLRLNPGSNREALIYKLITATNTADSIISKKEFKIDSIRLQCRFCKAPPSEELTTPFLFQQGKTSMPKNRIVMETKITRFYQNVENIVWPYLSSKSLMHIVYLQTRERDSFLKNNVKMPSLRQNIFGSRDAHDVSWFYKASLIRSILGYPNVSVFNERARCVAPNMKPGIHSTVLSKWESHIMVHEKQLRFVSCGYRNSRLFNFEDLISAFKYRVWIGISLKLLLVSIIISAVLKKNGEQNTQKLIDMYLSYIGEILFSCCKALVEQGDPIARKLFVDSRGRLIFLPFLFIAIVLSTAYKNENITRLTLPRAPKPFNSFQELVNNKFTIFTRLVWKSDGEVIIARPGVDFGKIIKRTYYDPHLISMTAIFTEILRFANLVSTDKNQSDCHPFHLSQCFFGRTRYLLNHTEFHHRWPELATGTLKQDDLLVKCNQTAVVLDNVEANRVYYKVKSRKQDVNVHIGDETLFTAAYALQFRYYVNPFVLKRFRTISEMGFWEWWGLSPRLTGESLGQVCASIFGPNSSWEVAVDRLTKFAQAI